MYSNPRSMSICACGCPRMKGDKIVIDEHVVYCNTFCHNRHNSPAHEFAPKPTGRIRFELEPDA